MEELGPAEPLARLAPEPSGRLATVRPDGRPHVVVVTFAVDEGDIVTAVDHKPKSTQQLQRLTNIEADPRVSFLVDHYESDWARLWWVRVDGTARVLEPDDTTRERALVMLAEKYTQYRTARPEGAVIAIEISYWRGWP